VNYLAVKWKGEKKRATARGRKRGSEAKKNI
jgi:hypothetical protein